MLSGRPLGGVHFGEIVVLFQASGNMVKGSMVDPRFLVLRSYFYLVTASMVIFNIILQCGSEKVTVGKP